MSQSQNSQLYCPSQNSIETLSTSSESCGSDSRRKSWITSSFCLAETEEGEMRRFCSFPGCQKHYSRSTSHKALRRHYRNKHGERPRPRGDGASIFSQHRHIDLYIVQIVMDEKPYSDADSKYTRRWWHEVIPDKIIVSRQYVSDAVISGADRLREMAKLRLSGAKSVALTFDLWSSRSSARSVACLTGHYIDDQWILRSLIIQFDSIPFPHTGRNMRQFVLDSITEMDIADKVISITTDNAKNNDVAFENFVSDSGRVVGVECPFEFNHYHCVAHIVNLGVKEALDELDELLLPARDIVHAMRCTPKRQELFKQIQLDLDCNCNPLMLVGEVETRWNSTFFMLRRVLKLKEPIIKALVEISDLETLTEPDWQLLERLVNFLEPFDEFTNIVSGETYATIGLVKLYVPHILDHCCVDYQDLKINRAACAFKLKLNDYKHHFDTQTPNLATVLDPRVKLSTLSDDQKQEACDSLRRYMGDNHNEERHVSTISSLKRRLMSSRVALPRDELQKYLLGPLEDTDCDATEFWSVNEKKIPKLAALAKMLLPIQATSTPSERTFSRASLIDTAHRNKLASESLRAGILARNYIKFLDLD